MLIPLYWLCYTTYILFNIWNFQKNQLFSEKIYKYINQRFCELGLKLIINLVLIGLNIWMLLKNEKNKTMFMKVLSEELGLIILLILYLLLLVQNKNVKEYFK